MKLKFTKFPKWTIVLLGFFALFSPGIAQTYFIVGTGTATTTASVYSPFGTLWEDGRHQYLVTAAQLSTSGMTAGLVSSLGFNISTAQTTPMSGYTIKIGNTALSTIPTTDFVDNSTFTTCFTGTFTPSVTGWTNHAFSNNFVWNGTSNIIVEVCYNNADGVSSSTAGVYYTTVASTAIGNYDDGLVGCTLDALTLGGTRPNIRFGWESNTPCAGAPAGGTATPATAAVCPSTNVLLSVTGGATGIGIVYQWQNSPDGNVWTNISGATASAYSGTQSVLTSYRRRTICTNGPDTSYSTASTVSMNPFLNCYCTASSTSTSTLFEKISQVNFGTLSNSSTAAAGYENFTALTPQDYIAGVSYPISISLSNGYALDQVFVWIDYNQNGVFTDPGELVYSPALGAGPFTGSVSISATATPGITRMRVRLHDSSDGPNSTSCGAASYGQVEDYSINILPPPTDEAGVLAITKPGIANCSLGQQLWVNVQNLGSNPLTSATFNVNINGLNLSPASPVTLNVPPQSAVEVQLPVSYSFADGDSITVSVLLPNGQTEAAAFAFNNTSARRVYAGLSGVKTVYGTNPDFANIDLAVAALVTRGVCDTVYFKIASGTYTTNHTFLPYLAAGPGKLAVFESATGVASDVNFTFSGTAGANYVFRFNGSSYYSIRNLSLKNTGTTYGEVIDINNNAHHLEFGNNTFSADTSMAMSGTDFDRTLFVTNYAGTDYDNLWIHNNQFIGGQRAIQIAVPDGEVLSNIVIENNTISKYALLGLLTANTQSIKFENNTLSGRTVAGTTSGAQFQAAYGGGKVSGNKINLTSAGYGILLSDVPGGSSPFEISNNFIYGADSSATGVGSGIFVEQFDLLTGNVIIANNSISFHGNNAAHGAINIASGNSISVINNNLGSFGNAPVLRVSSANSIEETSYNNFFGSTLANINNNSYSTLPSLQAAGFGNNSVNVNPGFSGSNLHTCAAALNAAGTPLTYITKDIDGDLRGNTPDIGADEFLGDAIGLLVQDAFLKCPSEQVTIGNTALTGITYSWTPSGSISQITTSNAGTYVLTATSSCGSFSDTATVVNKPLPTASFTSATVGMAAIFTNTSTNGTSYLWDFGDGTSSTDFSPTHVYSSASTYTVSLTVTNDCGSATAPSSPVSVINAGIEESATVNVTLFPNPTSDLFTVTMSAVNGDVTMISVIDVTGKTVMVKNIAAGVNQTTLDATTFASGVYSVKISNGTFTKVVRLVRK